MRAEELFEAFINLAKWFESELIEISIRQSQFSYIFKGDGLILSDVLNALDMPAEIFKYDSDKSYIHQENGYFKIVLSDYSGTDMNTQLFIDTITELADKVCKCPALEFVVSKEYIKCYLDKPGLGIKDLQKYEEIFEASGSLELNLQRPYFLFINEKAFSDLILEDSD